MALTFQFDFEATKAALLYLAAKELPYFDKYRAAKLLFLADREHLLRFGRTITGDTYSALPFGPTPDRTLELLNGLVRVSLEGANPSSDQVAELARHLDVSDLEHPTYHAVHDPDTEALSESDLEVLDDVANRYGRQSFNQLRDLTHGMRAYTAVWKPGVLQKKFPMRFEDFFDNNPVDGEIVAGLEEDQRLAGLFPSVEASQKVMRA